MTQCFTEYYTQAVLSLIMLAVLLQLAAHSSVMPQRWTQLFTQVIVLTMLMIAAEAATIWCTGRTAAWRGLHAAANAAGFGLSPFIPLLLAQVYEEITPQRRPRLCFLPAAAQLVLALLSPWTGWIFSVSAQNEYARGPLFFLYILSYLYGAGYLAGASWQQGRRFDRETAGAVSLLLAIFCAGTAVQVLWPEIHTTWRCVTIVLVLYYLLQRERLFRYDALTGLLNRQAFARRQESLTAGTFVAAAMFDLDSFKSVNDTLGHPAGDHYLRRAGQLVRQSFGTRCDCYRIGGDEFCAVCTVPGADLEPCRAALLREVEAARRLDSNTPSISCGLSQGQDGLEACLRRADAALYEEKRLHHSASKQR